MFIAKKTTPRKVAVRAVQNELLKLKCYLLPYCDVAPSDAAWEAIQQAGALGIVKGVGKSVDWENKTFFYPDSAIKTAEVKRNLQTYFGEKTPINNLKDGWLSIKEANHLIHQYLKQNGRNNFDAGFWNHTLHLANFDNARPITRRELAVLFIYHNKKFADSTIDFYGRTTNR